MANIGMMNEAYFVSKNVLIDWINNFCEIKIEKIEHCATGAIYCQIFDAIHPGCIKMSKIDFTVKQEYEYTKNWKLLQNAFNSLKIKKIIPVQRLIKARYQDNLEFLQWIYKYTRDTYNGNYESPEYDAIGRRLKSKGGKEFTGVPGQILKNNNNINTNSRPKRINTMQNSNNNTNNSIQSNLNTRNIQSRLNTGNISIRNNTNNSKLESQLKDIRNELELSKKENILLKTENNNIKSEKIKLELKITELNNEYENLAKTAADIEKERDFYFEKVLKCEQICKEFPDQSINLLKKIYNLLYKTDNNNDISNINTTNIDNNINNDIDNDININNNNNNDNINKFEIQTENIEQKNDENNIDIDNNNDNDNEMNIDP